MGLNQRKAEALCKGGETWELGAWKGQREAHDDSEASTLNGWWEDEICSAEGKLFGDEPYEFFSSPSFYCIRGHFLDETSPRALL